MALATLVDITRSKKAKFTPKDYKKMEPATNMGCNYESQYAGSGAALEDHPLKDESISFCRQQNVCDHCKSTNTLITFFSYYGDLVGKSSKIEIVCNDCGTFTQFSYDD